MKKESLQLDIENLVSSVEETAKKTELLTKSKKNKVQKLDKDGRKRINFPCDPELWEQVLDYAYYNRWNVAETMDKILRAYMKQQWNLKIPKRKKYVSIK